MDEITTTEIEEELSQELIAIDNQVLSLKVIDTATYLQAGEIFKAISAAEKRIHVRLDPLCEKANATHKALTTWRAEELEKYKPLKAHVNKEQTVYNIEQEKIRKAEEDRLRLEALKREEEDRLTSALQAEKEGNEEEAIAILEEPAFVPPPIVEKSVPKQAGLTLREYWDFEIVNEALIPRQFLTPNLVAIRAAVTSLKDKANIAGIKVIKTHKMVGVRT